MHVIIDFTSEGATRLDVSGGKGASLARTAADLPVPPGVIVTAEGYRTFMAPLREEVAAILASDDVDSAAAEVQALVRATDLPAGWAADLEAAMAAAGLPDGAFAVRSSGTMEDLPGAAFAGQHDTYLGVRGTEAILDKVRECYASLWNAHAMRYRERLGVDHLDAAMAVVVQQMVEVGAEEAAGVAFSVDPVRGALDTVLVNAAFGLGETVVGGEEPVDEFRLARADGIPLGEEVADKPRALVSLPEGGTAEVELPAGQRTRPALTPEQRAEVARLAVAAEEHAGFPQDIEWAFSGGRLCLLQSRPITRVAARLTRDESAERFPNPVTPLTWDLCEDGFHRSLNHSFALMGLPPFGDKWFVMKDYWIYGNRTAVELYSGRVPVRMLDDLESLAAAIPQIIQNYSWVQDLPLTWARDLDTYLLGIGALHSEPLQDKTIAEVWAHVRRISDLGNAYFLPNIAISLTQRTLYVALQRVLGLGGGGPQQVQAAFDTLLASTDTKTGQVNGELWELSRTVRRTPELRAALRSEGGRAVAERLGEFPDFAAAFELFLRRHGHRELDFDAYHPTWVEAPHIVLDQLGLMAERDDEDHAGDTRRQKVAQLETELAVLGATPDTLRFLVREVIRLARDYTALDDLEHYQTTRMTLPMRRAVRELGSRLVAEGVLDEPMDAFFLPVADLDRALGPSGDGDLAPLRDVAAHHKAGYAAAVAGEADWEFGESAAAAAVGAEHLSGVAGSAGSVEGEVFVVRGPEDFASFPSGAILVARTTNPAWTALFYQATGVITESGGALSHGAVTARELGLPAVMAVRGATSVLTSGQRVRVDGSAGTVTLLP